MENSDQNPINSSNIVEPVILPITLYTFGNRTSPRSPRPSIDIAVEKDLVKPTQPPTGASTFADIQYAPLTGHYYRLDKATPLPIGLAVIADGRDVGGTHSLPIILSIPGEKVTALQILNYLTLEERQSLFDELIKLTSVGHSDIELVRRAILSFDKTWLLDNIENQTKSLLENGTDEEYRRLLELYIQIDDGLTQRLVIKALQQSDIQIQEVGEDFENYLKTNQ